MSEFALIARHFRRPTADAAVRVGIGDDAAIVRAARGCELAFSVDMLVEGRHFLPGVDAATLGHKVLAVNLSDLAAVGATPRWALLAGALPDADDAWLDAFSRGLFSLADRYGVTLIGGDTTRGPRNLCLTIVGELPEGSAITRAGARVGDDVYVSGALGDAALALAGIEQRTPMDAATLAALRPRLDLPEPRVALGLRLRGLVSAAIDVSDGLSGDLQHVLDASGVGADLVLADIPRSGVLDARLRGATRPVALACLLAGGDDYELCFTAPPAHRAAVAAAGTAAGIAVTRVGAIGGAPGLRVRDEQGALLAEIPRAFDHFR